MAPLYHAGPAGRLLVMRNCDESSAVACRQATQLLVRVNKHLAMADYKQLGMSNVKERNGDGLKPLYHHKLLLLGRFHVAGSLGEKIRRRLRVIS